MERAALQLGGVTFVAACELLRDLSYRPEARLKTKVKHLAPHTLSVPQ